MVLNVLTVLTVLITNKNAILLASKLEAITELGIIENNLWALELYGCSFQAPHYLTWTWTDGNTLCSLISDLYCRCDCHVTTLHLNVQ